MARIIKLIRIFITLFILPCLFIYSGCSSGEERDKNAERFYQAGLNYIKSGQYDLAEKELNLAIEHDSTLYQAKKTLASLYFRKGDHSRLISLCKELMESKGNNIQTILIWGNSLTKMGMAKKAIEMLQMATKAFPDNLAIKFNLANALILDNRPKEAKIIVEEAAATNPEDIYARILLVRFYERLRLYALAEKKIEKLRHNFSERPGAYLAVARFYLRRNRLKDAKERLEGAIEKGFKNREIFHTLALIHHKQKNYNAALRSLKKAEVISPDDRKSSILLAEYYIFMKKYSQAKKTCEKIRKRWPLLLFARTKIAEILLIEGLYDQSLKYVEEILGKNPEYTGGHLLRGILWLGEGKTSSARKEFLIVRDLDPESAEADFFYGLTFLQDHNYEISISELLKALEKNPDSGRIRMALAYSYFKTSNLSSALKELNKILDTKPDNYWPRIIRAAVHLQSGNYKDAVSDYQHIIQKKGDSPHLRFRLAGIYLAQDKLDDALMGFSELLNSYPDPVRPLEEMVKIYLAGKQYEKAFSLCDDYLKQRPKDIRVSLIMANILIEQKKYEPAENILSTLIAQKSELDHSYMLMTRIYMIRQDYEAALRACRMAIEINPQNIRAYMKKAIIYKRIGNMNKAVDSYEDIFSTNEFYAPAANDLACLYADMNQNIDRALALALQVREFMPESPQAADTLGWVYLKKGSFLMARKYLREAIEWMPREPIFHYHLGKVFYEEKNFTRAKAELREAMRLEIKGKESTDVEKMLRELRSRKL